jgi:hypothetical protein
MNDDRIAALEAENAELRAALTAMAQRLADKAGWIEPKPVTPVIKSGPSQSWWFQTDVRDNDREWVTL